MKTNVNKIYTEHLKIDKKWYLKTDPTRKRAGLRSNLCPYSYVRKEKSAFKI